MVILTAILAAALAGAHLLAARIHLIAERHRRRWFSFAGGIAVSYIFIHLLPELDGHGHALQDLLPGGIVGHEVYLLALIGVCAFYGLERLAISIRRRTPPNEPEDTQIDHRLFWAHIGSFAVYNALVGYLLIDRDSQSSLSNILFAIALGLHFMVNDYALWQHHQHAYRRHGRWMLAVAVLIGWALGTVYSLAPPMVAGLFAFLAGGIIINVLKEELPGERQGRFGMFLLGVIIYAAILLATG